MTPVHEFKNSEISNCETDHELVPKTGSATSHFLIWLLEKSIVLPEEWEELPPQQREEISNLKSNELLLAKLVQRHLITSFQANRIREGLGEELALNHYRLLDILGKGGMGTVFRAEHVHLRRQVAIKVMSRSFSESSMLLHRFYSEARAIAKLQHPHIVCCLDAGRTTRTSDSNPVRDYFVMELISGQDLFSLVKEKGPLPPRRVCELFSQVASALGEAHRLRIFHRDIKPGNIIITPDWQAKVLDFGLARIPNGNVTQPDTLLGTIGYMAPEQARDPRSVDARADLFSLGATMYWTLTGCEPYPDSGNLVLDLQRRMTVSPASLRELRPETPVELADLVSRLMQLNPDDRYPSARAVAAALTGFSLWHSIPEVEESNLRPARREKVLVVDDDQRVRKMMTLLMAEKYDVHEAQDANSALNDVILHPPDLVVCDVQLPDANGADLIARIRKLHPNPERLKVMLVSGEIPSEALGGLAVEGADDFLTKPFTASEFQSRVRTLFLRRGMTRAGGEQLTMAGTARIPIYATVRTVEPVATAEHSIVAAKTLSFAISQLLADIGLLTDGHWNRVISYVRSLASAVAGEGEYARLQDPSYLDLLATFAPIHDVGLLCIPRNVLMKPDRLDSEEASVMQTHTTQGAELLTTIARKLGSEVNGLPLAVEICRSHHEHWDAGGYPDSLAGSMIPLSARVAAIVTVYEALRSRRPHRPALSHARAVRIITVESANQFDPVLRSAFSSAAIQFEHISQERR